MEISTELFEDVASALGINDWNDDALVRHIYDLYKINQHDPLGFEFAEIVKRTVKNDGEHYSHKHPEFLNNPMGELSNALLALQTDPLYKQQYANFLGPLVYSKEKPSYEQGLETILQLSERVWGKAVITAT